VVDIEYENPEVKRVTDKVAGDWDWTYRDYAETLVPDAPYFLRRTMLQNIYTDLARAMYMQADLAPDATYRGILRRFASDGVDAGTISGIRALSLRFPDIRKASWADVCDLRRDRGLANLRAKLREVESAGGSDHDVLLRLTREHDEYMEQFRPRWRKVAINVSWTLLSYVPLFTVPATVKPIRDGVKDVLRARNHWTAALMRVQRRLSRPSS
jgi:hypothetical protein